MVSFVGLTTASGLMHLASAKQPDYPTIEDFLPKPALFAGTPFAINRIILIRIILTVVILVVLGLTASHAKLILSRWQSVVEYGLDFVRESIVYDVIGKERGKRYVSTITTIFFSIFIFNLGAVIPFANMAATATICAPLVFALWSVYNYWAAGIRAHGLGGFLREELFPAGIPWPIYILLAPINLIEITLIRPFSLTVRLFANMLSGHLLVGMCLAATQFFFIETNTKIFAPFGVLTLAGGMFMTCFEIFVAGLQAYIFSILTASYISMSLGEEEEEEDKKVSQAAQPAAQLAAVSA